MADIAITDGIIVTMDQDRSIIDPGTVVVRDGEIEAVGKTDQIISKYTIDRRIDANGHVVLPGFIDSHIHVPDILSRGIGKERLLHDWLVNVKKPFVAAMTPSDHAVAAALYCYEAINFGVTTFVENAGGTGSGYSSDIIETKLAEYENAGIRNIYAHGFMDNPSGELGGMFESLRRKEPQVKHPPDTFVSTDEAVERTESLIEEYHGSADGRQSVWPAPYTAGNVSPEGLQRAYELAERHDVMTTTHTAESGLQERAPLSSVETLANTGYLGERTLLGHCVQLDDRDIQLLAETDTKVAHNIATNLIIGSGIAPIPELLRSGVTVGLGTDNACLNDTVNPLSDIRIIDLTHKGTNRHPKAVTPQSVLEMATIKGARAIGREDELGSIEVGKKADMALLDLNHPHLTPQNDIVQTLVYQAQGTEIDTVLCAGEVIMDNNRAPAVDGKYPDLYQESNKRAKKIIDRAGLSEIGE